MATRIYFDPVNAPSVSPNLIGTYQQTTGYVRRKMGIGTKLSGGSVTFSATETISSPSPHYLLLVQFVSEPVNAVTLHSTEANIAACFRDDESANAANMRRNWAIGYCDADGSNATLLASDSEGSEMDYDGVLSTGHNDFHPNTHNLSVPQGKRLIIELGISCTNSKSTSYTGYVRVTDNNATDLPAADGDTNDYNSWMDVYETITLAVTSPDITPSKGSLVLTGIAATALFAFNVTPGTAAVTYAGKSAEATQTIPRQPETGSVSLAGYKPGMDVSISGSKGNIAITGYGPSVVQNFNIQSSGQAATISGKSPVLDIGIHPSTSSITYSGSQPTVTTPINITPSTGSVQYTGLQVPAEDISRTPTTGTYSFYGQSPIIDYGIVPAKGAVTITPIQPNLDAGITPAKASAAYAASQAKIDTGIIPAKAAAAISASQPRLDIGITPAKGSVAFAVSSTSVGAGITPQTSVPVAYTGKTPLFAFDVTPVTGSVEYLGRMAVLTGEGEYLPETAAVAVQGYGPSLEIGIQPAHSSLVVSGSIPETDTGITVQASSILYSGLQPVVEETSPSVVVPVSGEVVLAGQQVVTSMDLLFVPETGHLGAVVAGGYEMILVDGKGALQLNGRVYMRA